MSAFRTFQQQISPRLPHRHDTFSGTFWYIGIQYHENLAHDHHLNLIYEHRQILNFARHINLSSVQH